MRSSLDARDSRLIAYDLIFGWSLYLEPSSSRASSASIGCHLSIKFEIQIKALQYFGQCLKLAKYFIFRKSYSWIKNLFVEPSYSGSNNIYISTIESIPLVSGLYSPDSWQFSKSIKSFFKAKKINWVCSNFIYS